MRRRKKRAQERREELVAAGLAAAAALIAVGLLRRRSRDRSAGGRAREQEADTRGEWQCECGQALLVSGEGRHRVFWVLGAPLEDPLLADSCPNCERVLSLQG